MRRSTIKVYALLLSDYMKQCEHITGTAEWDKVLLDSVSDTFLKAAVRQREGKEQH